MHNLGMAIGWCAFLLEGLLILRGATSRVFKLFPLFYSYIIYCFCGFLAMSLIYWLCSRQAYATAYWIYLLISILVEFTVLVEISDQVFRPFPAIRHLGRALTILISASFGILYILPTILWSTGRSLALLDFALRASITKAVILVVLFYSARHYGSQLGRNVGGLMLGFSIYVAMNVAMWASAKAFGSALFASTLWVMGPAAAALCLLVWTVSLWETVPMPSLQTISPVPERDSEAVALELTRFNSQLSRILRK
jgi:hypothetical protein